MWKRGSAAGELAAGELGAGEPGSFRTLWSIGAGPVAVWLALWEGVGGGGWQEHVHKECSGSFKRINKQLYTDDGNFVGP